VRCVEHGSILYIVLCGAPPFDEEEAKWTHQTINAIYDISGSDWADISDSAKDLVKRMMCADPKKRITVQEALEHSWITNNGGGKHLGTSQAQMKKYLARRRFKLGIHTVLATNRFSLLGKKKHAQEEHDHQHENSNEHHEDIHDSHHEDIHDSHHEDIHEHEHEELHEESHEHQHEELPNLGYDNLKQEEEVIEIQKIETELNKEEQQHSTQQ